MVHFGEGTTSLGHVHEAMNFAAVMKLPVIFICNNNQFAYSTPLEKQFAVSRSPVRGPAYGMPGESVDGTDVLAVHEAVERASARARAGKGPSFLECIAMRMAGHSAHDAAEYVPEKLKQAWAKKDPIAAARKVVARQEDRDPRSRSKKSTAAFVQEIDAAIAEAEARPCRAERKRWRAFTADQTVGGGNRLPMPVVPSSIANGQRTRDQRANDHANTRFT